MGQDDVERTDGQRLCPLPAPQKEALFIRKCAISAINTSENMSDKSQSKGYTI